MTVAELIAELQKMPPDMEVVHSGDWGVERFDRVGVWPLAFEDLVVLDRA